MTRLAWRKAKNAVMILLMASAALTVLVPLVLIFVHIVRMGGSAVNLDFFTKIPSFTERKISSGSDSPRSIIVFVIRQIGR